MRQRIDAALATVEAGFRQSTIADLLHAPDRPQRGKISPATLARREVLDLK